MKASKADVIYPCRIPRDLFRRVRQLAEQRDLSASQVIRLALRKIVEMDQSSQPQPSER